jgi:WD40 repeat protein
MSSPFKFLDAYTREDRAIFFGRDREIEVMYQKVFESKILLIYGISGTGKTSLINCGLANKFEESDWLPVNVRRGFNINESLWEELKELWGEEANEGGEIVKILRSIYLDHFKPIYLIFDQFEELFIFGNREERVEFIKMVKAITDSDIQCRFIFSIREEYLACVTEFEDVIPDFLINRMRIESMTHQSAIEAIEGPCKVQGIEVEEGFAQVLLEKLIPEGKEIELTYLQVFLDKVYKIALLESSTRDSALRINPGLRLTRSLLDRIGDASDLLGSFLEEQISQMENPEVGLTILKSFVSVKGTKRQMTQEDVVDFSRTIGKQIEQSTLTELIQRFINLRILKDKDENDRYELRHDSLAAKIYEKITLVEKELLDVRQFIENEYETYKKRKILLSDKDLKYLQVYEDRLFLGDNLKEFLELSKNSIHAKRRQFNTILRISLIGFILLLVSVIYYYFQSASERINIQRSTKSLVQSDIVPQLSFRTAVEAYHKDSTSSVAHFAVLNSFYRLLGYGKYYDSLNKSFCDPYKKIFDFNPCQANILSAAFSQDGKLIYGWLSDQTIKVWDNHGKELHEISGMRNSIIAASLSVNNEYIAIVCNDSSGRVYNMSGERIFDFPVALNPVFNNKVTDFSPDNRFLAVAGSDKDIVLYELSGSEFQKLTGHRGRINYISFSPDSRFIASASDDKTVIIWNYNRNNDLFNPYDTLQGHLSAVRSCNFSNNSKYVLTAADDSTVAIWKLDGKCVYQYWLNGYSWMSFPLDKACNAEFTRDEKLIMITRYRVNNSDTAGSFLFSQTLLTQNESYFEYLFPSRNRMVFNDFDEIPDQIKEVKYLDYSTRDHIIAIVPTDKNQVILISHDLMPIKNFNGTRPVFSPDGDYLLCISGKELNLYPVSASELIRLVMEQKIFGEKDIRSGEWVHYF